MTHPEPPQERSLRERVDDAVSWFTHRRHDEATPSDPTGDPAAQTPVYGSAGDVAPVTTPDDVPETDSDVPDTDSDVPETDSDVTDASDTVPATDSDVAQASDTVPATDSAVPETDAAVPETASAVAETEAAVPESDAVLAHSTQGDAPLTDEQGHADEQAHAEEQAHEAAADAEPEPVTTSDGSIVATGDAAAGLVAGSGHADEGSTDHVPAEDVPADDASAEGESALEHEEQAVPAEATAAPSDVPADVPVDVPADQATPDVPADESRGPAGAGTADLTDQQAESLYGRPATQMDAGPDTQAYQPIEEDSSPPRSLYRDEAIAAGAAGVGAAGVAALASTGRGAEETVILDADEQAWMRDEERVARDRSLGKVETVDDAPSGPAPFAVPTTYRGFPSFGFFLLRLVVAGILGVRAYQHITGLTATKAMWANTVLPQPELVAWVQIGLEIAIAVMLLLGLATRIAGLALLVLSVALLAFVLWGVAPILSQGTYGFLGDLDLLLATLGLFFFATGGGGAGIDANIHRGRIQRKNDKAVAS